MTGEPDVVGEPGVVGVPGLPGVVGGPVPGLPGPGETGTCSEYTDRLTVDC